MSKMASTSTYAQIDETAGRHGQTEILERVYRITPGNLKVRIRVHRDTYASQSFATADVLAADRTWTTLAIAPSSEWHASATRPQVAGELIERAARILS
jgi:hypothetical protein